MSLYHACRRVKYSGKDFIETGLVKDSDRPVNTLYVHLKSREQNRILELTEQEAGHIVELLSDAMLNLILKEDGRVEDKELKWIKK